MSAKSLMRNALKISALWSLFWPAFSPGQELTSPSQGAADGWRDEYWGSEASTPAERSNKGALDFDGLVITIEGGRASLEKAQERKGRSLAIVDSVVAEDIGKLPDTSVTDAVQRVTGVQVSRDRGEGGGVAVRGLSQLETTLNGRDAYTAGSGRTFQLSDIAAETVAGIDVYKTSSADRIEGGLGGTIDVRTRRPFDFDGPQATASAGWVYGDRVGRGAGQYSALLSNRWRTGGRTEFGLLINGVSQNRAWREDQNTTGAPMASDTIIQGQTVVVPNGTSETVSAGERERTGGSIGFQWQPSPGLEFYGEGGIETFRTLQDSYQINIYPSSEVVAGSPVLFPGTNDVQSIAWANAPVSVLSFARDTVDRNRRAALGARWRIDRLSMNADLSYSDSHNDLYFSGLNLKSTAATFSQSLSGATPSTGVSGTDLLDPANYQYSSVLYRTWAFDGSARTARFDGRYDMGGRFIDSFKAGMRLTQRTATDTNGVIVADTAVGDIAATTMPDYIRPNPYSNSLPGSASIGPYLAGDISSARDPMGLWNAFGISGSPPASNPLGMWRIDESTQAAYVMADLMMVNPSLDGNMGVRVVRTVDVVSGNQSAPSGSIVSPIQLKNSYVDTLPSLNLRYKPRDGLNLRLSLSKTISRPDFNVLSPSLTLIRNSVDPSRNQGSGGNAYLRPVRADNLDLAIERYFDTTASIFLTGFMKDIDGFVTTVSAPELHDGELYQVSRPQNAHTGKVRGAELGYQQFFDFLPGWMSGLGMQANYTYVESASISPLLGTTAPLAGFSRNSCNVVALYEKGRVSARLAYNWRSRFLSGIANIVGIGALPIYTRGYGWLDASFGYRIGEHVTLSIEGNNLLRTERSAYYGVETRPNSTWRNDAQFGLRVSAQL